MLTLRLNSQFLLYNQGSSPDNPLLNTSFFLDKHYHVVCAIRRLQRIKSVFPFRLSDLANVSEAAENIQMTKFEIASLQGPADVAFWKGLEDLWGDEIVWEEGGHFDVEAVVVWKSLKAKGGGGDAGSLRKYPSESCGKLCRIGDTR